MASAGQGGTFAEGWVADACDSCGLAYLAALGSLVALSVCMALACPLACGRGVPLADVALEDCGVVLTTTCGHRFLHRALAAFDVHFHGTGTPGLDRPGTGLHDTPTPLKVRVLSWNRLLLLDQQGRVINTRLDASQGKVRVQVPQAFLALGVAGVPVGPLMLVLLALWASSAVALVRLEPTSPNAAVVAVVLALAAAVGLAKEWRWRRAAARAPMREQIKIFRERIRQQHPHPRACERGPGRAVTMAQLDDLHVAFQAFIRDTRNMLYLCENVLKPITAPEKLSYAELVGPSLVEWFCCHFWGTPFAYFVASVRQHAMAVGQREGRDARLMSYWIDCFSNNQWVIVDEVAGHWQESSFYLALRSGHCRGTAMILDEMASPLTRSWCLFEVLQTMVRCREDAQFQGLLLCTSTGVLNYGAANAPVAFAITQHLLDLRQASAASIYQDKEMIDNMVVQEFGGFRPVNDFLRGCLGDAVDGLGFRVDPASSEPGVELADGPVPGAMPPQRQPMPTLLGSSNRDGPLDARRTAGEPAPKNSPPQGALSQRDECLEV